MEPDLRRIVGATLLALGLLAAEQAAAQHFQGKIISMMINYPAGGNADTEGRIFQRHLTRHIAGNPSMIVTHRPGAGGMVGVNWMGSGNAPTDGTLFCFCTLNIVEPLIGGQTLKVNYQDFAYITSVRQWFAAYGRKDIPPGIKTPTDMARATDVFGAGYSPSNSHDMTIKLSLELIGAKYRMVSGLRSIGDINLSIQNKETNFTLSSMPAFMSVTLPGIIHEGVATSLWYFPVVGRDGKPARRSQELDGLGIRPFADVFREAHGKDPAGASWDALVMLNNLSTTLLRTVLMPPNSPKAAVAELRKAFAAVVEDKEFQDEYMRIIKVKAEIVPVEEGEALLTSIKTIEPATEELLKKLAIWN